MGKTSLLVQFDQGKFIPGSFSATVGIGFTVIHPVNEKYQPSTSAWGRRIDRFKTQRCQKSDASDSVHSRLLCWQNKVLTVDELKVRLQVSDADSDSWESYCKSLMNPLIQEKSDHYDGWMSVSFCLRSGTQRDRRGFGASHMRITEMLRVRNINPLLSVSVVWGVRWFYSKRWWVYCWSHSSSPALWHHQQILLRQHTGTNFISSHYMHMNTCKINNILNNNI